MRLSLVWMRRRFVLASGLIALAVFGACSDSGGVESEAPPRAEGIRGALEATREASALASEAKFDAALVAWRRAEKLDHHHPRSDLIRQLEIPAADDRVRALQAGRRAQEAAAKNDHIAAIRELRRARQANPLHYGLRLMEAKTLAYIRRFDEAARAAEAMRQLYPTRREGWSLAAEVAFARGAPREAAAHLRALHAELGESRLATSRNREDYLLAAGTAAEQSEHSIALLEKILQRCPKDLDARQLLATRFEARGDFENATQQFRELMDLGVQNYSLWVRLAKSLERSGRIEEAIAAFESASTRSGGRGLALIHAARLRGQLEDRESWLRAERELDAAIDVSPGLIPALEAALRLKKRLGKKEELPLLRQLLETARERDRHRTDTLRRMRDRLRAEPEDFEARRALIDYYFEIKDAGEAMSLVRELLIAEPNHPDGLAWSAQFFHETGKLEAAWWEALNLSESAPEDHRGPMRLALVAATRRMPEACLNSGERALRCGAPQHQLRDALQWALKSPAGAKDPQRQRRIEALLR
jgi:predicted Zn-dependent protease